MGPGPVKWERKSAGASSEKSFLANQRSGLSSSGNFVI